VTEGAAGRYAAALFELANEQSALAEIEADLAKFQGLLDESADLRSLVRSPVTSRSEQSNALGALAAKAGIGATTGNFLKLIAKNGRLFAVGDMMKAFRTLAARQRGEAMAEVTSAIPLTPEQLATLADTLKASVGKNVKLTTRIDPGLLGGLVVKIGSRMVDSSLRTKLTGLKVALRG